MWIWGVITFLPLPPSLLPLSFFPGCVCLGIGEFAVPFPLMHIHTLHTFRYMRMENILMLTLAFVINVFVVCVFAEVRPSLDPAHNCYSPRLRDTSPPILVLRRQPPGTPVDTPLLTAPFSPTQGFYDPLGPSSEEPLGLESAGDHLAERYGNTFRSVMGTEGRVQRATLSEGSAFTAVTGAEGEG